MFEILKDFTFINFLSVLAFVTTVGLFFCGIPICRQIWKRKDTREISGAPFLMGVLGGTCWMVYGYLKKDRTVEYVTFAQIILYSIYTVFYWIMSVKKFWITLKISALISFCGGLVAAVHFFGHKIFHPLGILCMTLNTMDFGAPLAGMKTVIQRKATSTLPLPLCIANFLVSSEWFVYGLLVKDIYLIIPNGIGSLLATSQIILFIVIPRKPGQNSPIVRLYYFIRDYVCCCGSRKFDIESAPVVPEFGDNKKDLLTRFSGHRWSNRIVPNINEGFMENNAKKMTISEQFVYPMTQEKSSDEASSTDTSIVTPEHGHYIVDETKELETQVVVESPIPPLPQSQQQVDDMPSLSDYDEDDDDDYSTEQIPDCNSGCEIKFPITIKDQSQLFKLSRRLSGKHSFVSSNKKKIGFGLKKLNFFETSLQPYHFRTLVEDLPYKNDDEIVGKIDEEDELSQTHIVKKDSMPKRAKSEPNLSNNI